ncbi:hypothetical protein FQN54_009168 [Arachnomyces sp. PD_36]|nr:hypothetical protein FQN54_009168 [Arachnomyces sp. PD_36]
MAPTERRLLRGKTITYSQALDKEINMLQRLEYPARQDEFFDSIWKRRDLIAEVVCWHLGISPSACKVVDEEGWRHGSFNLLVPVVFDGFAPVLIRFPLPYRNGESFRPGNCEEKVKCEAATYAWIQQECPELVTPHLYGFGTSGGKCFVSLEHLPFLTRWREKIRRYFLSFMGYPMPSRFVQRKNSTARDLGPYLLLEWIPEPKMLSETWKLKRTDKRLRSNLFRGIAGVMLSLSRVPLPRIGSFTIDDNGYLHLANKPLTVTPAELENESIPLDFPREQTIPSVDSYVNSILYCHDSRLRHQPNAVTSYGDAGSQITALTLMRTIRPDFFQPKYNYGPFVLCLDDMHASNILVDEDWNIRCLVDLEWASTVPVEFMQPPSWLTDQAVDLIDYEAYDTVRQEFMDIFEEVERSYPPVSKESRADIMKSGWDKGTFWYTLALRSVTGLHAIFYDRLQVRYNKNHADEPIFYTTLLHYWTWGGVTIMHDKVKDKEKYDKKLAEEFDVPTPTTAPDLKE